ncbi:hypothetical protein VTK73DRAFT_5495 [Phialemonium thermophilum]|uniref:Uncharacterized protein n=1 Tax=Phialemonium thermophilum TaxID=223376 RepID=A0ABR3V1F8_9PEZI
MSASTDYTVPGPTPKSLVTSACPCSVPKYVPWDRGSGAFAVRELRLVNGTFDDTTNAYGFPTWALDGRIVCSM